jgi:hypothetical protein
MNRNYEVEMIYAGLLDQPATQPPLITPMIANTDATGGRVLALCTRRSYFDVTRLPAPSRAWVSQEKRKLPFDCGCACPRKPWVLCIVGPVPCLNRVVWLMFRWNGRGCGSEGSYTAAATALRLSSKAWHTLKQNMQNVEKIQWTGVTNGEECTPVKVNPQPSHHVAIGGRAVPIIHNIQGVFTVDLTRRPTSSQALKWQEKNTMVV